MIMEELNDLENLDFFDDDYETHSEQEVNNQEQENQEGNESYQQDSEEDTDVLSWYLQSKGIDINSIKMENSDGNVEEYKFSDLSRDEQLQLLDYNPAEREAPDLTDDEARLLSIMRGNNMSVQDYLKAYRNHVIQQYQASMPASQEQFEVDDYSDEELFIADLKDKVPDLTEEEAIEELELQKQNESLFQKKVAGIRANYQERENAIKQQEYAQAMAQRQQQAQQFESVIVDTIQNNSSIDLGDTSLELSEDDMNEIASFILDSDSAGVRHIAKALNDPRMLVEMAWWALKGHDALNQVTQYYKKQIANAHKAARQDKPKTVVTKKSNNSNVSNERDLFDNLI